jgi:hypothetical protein
MAEVNLLTLYKLAFGYVSSPHSKSGIAVSVPEASSFNPDNLGTVEFKEYSSVFGTPIFMPVVLEIPGLKWRCPNEPVVTIDLNKRIIETEVDGQNGTFKEGYSLGDYEIRIDGIIVNELDAQERYPNEEVAKLRRIVEHKGAVKVYCELLSIFNVNEIAVYSMGLPAVPGEPSAAAYTLTCKSDGNYDFIVKR